MLEGEPGSPNDEFVGRWLLTPEANEGSFDNSRISNPDTRFASQLARWINENPAPEGVEEPLMMENPDRTFQFRWPEAGEEIQDRWVDPAERQ